MLEEKVEELKMKIILGNNLIKNDVIVDLNIWAYLDNNFFESELDKINFYREIEYINDINDLINLENDFTEINWELKMKIKIYLIFLKLRLISKNYKIKSIKRSWVSFEIIFNENFTTIELKNFLRPR